MKQLAFAVYDNKAGSYFPPFFTRTPALALRWFKAQIGNVEHDFHKFPEDFVLMQLGQFDDESGILETPKQGPQPVATALAIKTVLVNEAANVVNLKE